MDTTDQPSVTPIKSVIAAMDMVSDMVLVMVLDMEDMGLDMDIIKKIYQHSIIDNFLIVKTSPYR